MVPVSADLVRTKIKIALVAWWPLLFVCSLTADQPPNIVFILTDDHGVDAIEGEHWPNTLDVQTPTLATLASRGRVMVNARVDPWCSPTRAGVMTGRLAHRTGVSAVYTNHPHAPLIGMQSEERTIVEVLRDVGYDTIHVDKWQLGVGDQGARAQGFDQTIPRESFLDLDDSIDVGDEHVTRMVNKALKVVEDHTDPTRPYAVFFHASDPHIRTDPTGRDPLGWWRVDESLLPSGEMYYHEDRADDTKRDRYRALVEALDTELGRLLQAMGVIDANLRYRPESRTVVIFMGDNGTPGAVTDDPANAKGTLYDGGTRVPLFCFGENVPSDGRAITVPVSHVDLFETIADIAGASGEQRGSSVRDSLSVADLIGWAPPRTRRRFTVSAGELLFVQIFRAAITDGRYKVISDGGEAGLKPLDGDEFYDLVNDPLETTDISLEDMNIEQQRIYREMRDALADAWPFSVPEPVATLDIDVAATETRCINTDDIEFSDSLVVGHQIIAAGGPVASRDVTETRAFIRFDLSDLPRELASRGATIHDIVAARLVLSLESDVPVVVGGGNASVLHVRPMSLDWRDRALPFSDLEHGVGDPVVGEWEPAPHLFAAREDGFRVLPTPPGTPLSLGRHKALVDLVQTWAMRPETNRGVVLIGTDPSPDRTGDLRTRFQRQATLRLALRVDR